MTGALLGMLAIALVSGRADTGSQLRWHSYCGPLTKVLEEIGTCEGKKLRAAPRFEGIVVYVRFGDRDEEACLAKIAAELRGEWRDVGAFSTLQPIKGWSDEIRLEETADVKRLLVGNLARVTFADDPRSVDGARATLRRTLVSAILKGLGIDYFAAMPFGRGRYLSNQPSVGEEQLPEPVVQAVATYNEGMQELAARRSRPVRSSALGDNRPLGRLWLSVGRSDTSLGMNLLGYDASGTQKLYIPLRIPLTPETLPTARVEADEEPVNLSDLARAIARTYANAGKSQSLATDVRRKLQDPSTLDPAEWIVAPALAEHAEWRKLSVACVVPDAATPCLVVNPPRFFGEVRAALAGAGAPLSEGSDWLTSQPTWRALEPRDYLSRSALAAWVHDTTVRSGPFAVLRARSILYAKIGADSLSSSTLLNLYRWDVLSCLGVDVPLANAMVPDAAIALGTLSDQEWSDLLAGRPIEVGVDPDRRGAIDSWCRGPTILVAEGVPDVYKVGTFSLPFGPPHTATLSVSIGSTFFVRESDVSKPDTITLGDLADDLVNEAGARSEDQANSLITDAYDVLTRPKLTLRVTISDKAWLETSEDDSSFQVVAARSVYKDWPAGAKTAIQNEFEWIFTTGHRPKGGSQGP